MTIGERIKRIRIFRGMTQKELGLKIGYEEKNADVRIAQYESNYRIPKKDTIVLIAEALDINYLAIKDYDLGSAEDIMQTLFWLDEQSEGVLALFPMAPTEKDIQAEGIYNEDNFWGYGIHKPVGIALNYPLVNEFLQEWLIRQTELQHGDITKEEYFEWKINWPYTCDDCGKVVPKKKWLK